MFAIAWLFNILERGNAAYQRIEAILSIQSRLISGKMSSTEDSHGLSINIKQFAHENGIALQNICLHVHPGEFIGIVLVLLEQAKVHYLILIQRFADPLQGSITLNGLDLKNWELALLRQQYAYVPQEPYLFSLSVAENIALGTPDASEAEIIAAASNHGRNYQIFLGYRKDIRPLSANVVSRCQGDKNSDWRWLVHI